MPQRVPLKFPPGFSRPGTVYDAKGRWYDGNLVRWYEGVLQAVGGWQDLEVTTPSVAQVDVGGPARGIAAWRANDLSSHLAVGTPTKLYHYAGGVLTDITPAGFTTGDADASYSGGGGSGAAYGVGAYGVGLYGAGDSAQQTLNEADSWQLDTYGEDLVACATSDGKIYYWDKSVGGAATQITNSPTGCVGVVVTPERFVVALGGDGDARSIRFADRDDITIWSATSGNQAGTLNLPGSGKIMAGRRSRNETLIWTDIDLFGLTFIGGNFVYKLRELGSNCGVISRHAMAVLDGRAVWMGKRDFYLYNGFVQKLPCEVADFVFNDINRTQVSKINTITRSEFNEVTWHYPSAASDENDRYVTVTFVGGSIFWTFGALDRTAGVDRGVFEYPLAFDSDGLGYQHEVGSSYDGATPFVESGPYEIAAGTKVAALVGLVPDEVTTGGVQARLYTAFEPKGTETLRGPYTLTSKTDLRVTARQIRLRLDQVSGGWRWGTPRLLLEQGGER